MAGLEEASDRADTPEPLFAAREVCDVDVLALFERTPRRLLLVDCKATDAGGESPAGQLVQALRNALIVRGNVLVGPCETRLVLLRGWKPGATPSLPSQLPIWRDDRDWLRREHVSFWGFHAFRMPTGVDATFLDTWEALDADPRVAATKRSDVEVYAPRRALSRKSKLEQELEPRLRVHLRLSAEEHGTALRDESSALGRLRLAAHGDESPPGWKFAGELNDKGCVRLVWEPEPSLGVDTSALETWVNAYLQRGGT